LQLPDSYACRVCGLLAGEPPWGQDGRSPLYDFCPCCGVEHGYQDSSVAGARKFRAAWQAAGGAWEDVRSKPANWSLELQLENVPAAFR